MTSRNLLIGIAVSCFLGVSVLAIRGHASEPTEKRSPDVQIRLFADRGVALPTGKKGGAIQIYGMEVQEDGSEKVVWKMYLAEFPGGGLLFPHDYRLLPMNEKTAYLDIAFLSGGRNENFIEINRKTGQIVRRAGGDDRAFQELKKGSMWYSMVIIDRPMVDNPQPQTAE